MEVRTFSDISFFELIIMPEPKKRPVTMSSDTMTIIRCFMRRDLCLYYSLAQM